MGNTVKHALPPPRSSWTSESHHGRGSTRFLWPGIFFFFWRVYMLRCMTGNPVFFLETSQDSRRLFLKGDCCVSPVLPVSGLLSLTPSSSPPTRGGGNRCNTHKVLLVMTPGKSKRAKRGRKGFDVCPPVCVKKLQFCFVCIQGSLWQSRVALTLLCDGRWL